MTAAEQAAEELRKVKKFCRIDHDEDDDEVADLIASAKAYLAGAGIPPASPLYELTVKNLVLHWYDNREDGKTLTVGLRQLINQQKLSQVADTETW